MDLTKKTVIITGASRGIGAAAARMFAECGANVALLARSTAEIDAIAAEIGENAMAIACDVASFEQVDAAVARTIDRFGTVDVMINNAGVVDPISHLSTSDPAGWDRVIDINLKGVYHGIRAVQPVMEAAGGGTVLTISSGAAHGPVEGWSHYCASKAAVHMLNRCLDKEARDKGIRAITLSPGTVATEMQREIKASGINPVSKLEWSDHVPPEWPALALIWMCGPDADEYLGDEVKLGDESIRRAIGVI
ncbi:MAG: SDR family oxidoreductase [Brevirhabdus sp.]